MIIKSLRDLKENESKLGSHDLSIFCSGYEERCLHLATSAQFDRSKSLVLGFSDFNQERLRLRHDETYIGHFGVASMEPKVGSQDDEAIYSILRTRLAHHASKHLTVLVDYSSMPRFWYACILNWFRANSDRYESVDIDFCYVGGRYVDDVPEKIIGKIISVPGCEGTALGDRHSVSIFGLGFERFSPFTIVERTEPKDIFAFVADPGSDPSYPARALLANRDFINEHVSDTAKLIALPLNRLEEAYVILAELISPYRGVADISITPCGPKPHVLISNLLSLRFRDVTCLYVSGLPTRPLNVLPNGLLHILRVHLEHDDKSAAASYAAPETIF